MDPIVRIYDLLLAPVPPFTWFGLSFSTLDVAGAVRLCVALRQIKELLHKQQAVEPGGKVAKIEDDSFVKSAAATLTVVFGGEVVTGPLLGVTPSFMISPTVTALFVGIQALVDKFPSIPAPFYELEMPLSILDGFTRAALLCDFIAPSVTANASSKIAESPWTLLITAFLSANGGFFLVNLLSFMHPGGLKLQTPPEMLPYGWTTTDLWCAPLITGLYAFLTHAQPFWGELRTSFMGANTAPVDPASARALCALVLVGLFTVRTTKNFRQVAQPAEKVKTQ
ncbi:hypothetical protein CYLTODRAFT_423253 [Cylindrobasidium torrendii FP15055 ss-10]|uniref:Uncharacterized protein n=1 Tax=Cylindrobasidium torrendii FP15055 ss-10 TaxID=1314674 RepID=A0A0D7BAU9_9AGAR|nr:hypothetical protein CYLTODRAFT_423253 [Cylindrobasidium torrendii FP15055 ss-10]